MKRKIFTMWITLILMFFAAVYQTDIQQSFAQEETIPSYAKWGRLAMKKTMEKYPSANIIDYLHVGNKQKGNNEIEQFKLWLNEDGKEFGVVVEIEFDSKTEEVISITFKETDN